ncbi:MAG: NADH-quinone oxidoreductase subunit H [Deltaproteobacteria bacterium]|nr:NADH-quinone oxidoreductase subunit H [Deltaproteobacteria bacterium]
MLLLALNLSVVLLWVERKGSALIQDRVGANRANIFGGLLPFNLGIVNTLIADPIKMFTKEDVIPVGADKLLHFLGPFLAVFPVLVTFAAVPFGDVLVVGDRTINLQVADLNVGILYVLAMSGLSVYGIVLGGWASNSRWSLLGAIRGSAQMISYEIAMGLGLIGAILTYGTLDLQAIARAQGANVWGVLPAWGIFYQPLGFLIFLVAGIAETKRVPFDLPEGESELTSGYFTEYSGSKQATFMLSDFAEIVVVSALATTLFFGAWQVPYLGRDGFHFPGGFALALPQLVVVVAQIVSFLLKVLVLCCLQILVRWSLPRYRYDQLMDLGWKRLLPLALLNVLVTAAVIVLVG